MAVAARHILSYLVFHNIPRSLASTLRVTVSVLQGNKRILLQKMFLCQESIATFVTFSSSFFFFFFILFLHTRVFRLPLPLSRTGKFHTNTFNILNCLSQRIWEKSLVKPLQEVASPNLSQTCLPNQTCLQSVIFHLDNPVSTTDGFGRSS